MTLSDLVNTLKTMDAHAPLVFSTPDAVIGGGYHVTELKALSITSIDCAGRVSETSEAALQLLDSTGDSHMRVGKFVGILESSLDALEALQDAPAHIEFAPNNAGLHRFEVASVRQTAEKVDIALKEAKATCKPAFAFQSRAMELNQPVTAKCCQ